jgi:hypothetical protein
MSNYQDLPFLLKTTYQEIMRGWQADRDSALRGLQSEGPAGLGILSWAEVQDRKDAVLKAYQQIKECILNELDESIKRESERLGLDSTPVKQ